MSDFDSTKISVWEAAKVKEVLPRLAPLLEANGDIISTKIATLKENLKTNNKWGLAQGPIKVNFAETLTPFGNFECQNEKGTGLT